MKKLLVLAIPSLETWLFCICKFYLSVAIVLDILSFDTFLIGTKNKTDELGPFWIHIFAYLLDLCSFKEQILKLYRLWEIYLINGN